MEDEAARPRQRVTGHARGKTGGKLHERRTARPEGEMSGGARSRQSPRAEKGLGDPRDQIDALRRKGRREATADLAKLRHERLVVEGGFARAGAESDDISQHSSCLGRL